MESCLLKTSGTKFLAVDVDSSGANDVLVCDLRKKDDVARLFQSQPVHSVIHLAGILPTAFRSDPLVAADLNLTASIELLRQSTSAHVKRFVFASSRSVYGTSPTSRLLFETDPATPDDPYGHRSEWSNWSAKRSPAHNQSSLCPCVLPS